MKEQKAEQNQQNNTFFSDTHAKVLGLFLMKLPMDQIALTTIKVFPVQFESNDLNVIFALLRNAPDLNAPELYDMVVKLL